ncbi:MAG: hypothetical protein EXQ90_07750 [Rhodospirillales bacterium]|nr:hypothetical protein [Rhodospirillales bacterium]
MGDLVAGALVGGLDRRLTGAVAPHQIGARGEGGLSRTEIVAGDRFEQLLSGAGDRRGLGFAHRGAGENRADAHGEHGRLDATASETDVS